MTFSFTSFLEGNGMGTRHELSILNDMDSRKPFVNLAGTGKGVIQHHCSYQRLRPGAYTLIGSYPGRVAAYEAACWRSIFSFFYNWELYCPMSYYLCNKYSACSLYHSVPVGWPCSGPLLLPDCGFLRFCIPIYFTARTRCMPLGCLGQPHSG